MATTTEKKIQAVKSFKAGGRSYISHIMGGVVLNAGTTVYNQFFPGTYGSPGSYTNLLTNLSNMGKLGSQECFEVLRYGFRISKLTAGVATPAQIQATTAFLNSSRFYFEIGDAGTRVLDIQLARFSSTISAVANPTSATDNQAFGATIPISNVAWLEIAATTGKEPIEPNMNFSATLENNLYDGTNTGTPTGIGTTASPIFILNFLAEGIRTVKG